MTRLTVAFGTLRNACLAHGFKARLYIFEGGETVEIADDKNGAQIVRTTAMHGDDVAAATLAAAQMIDMHLLSLADFEG
jgi:hypothetical protein